jgi:hypothetical protein
MVLRISCAAVINLFHVSRGRMSLETTLISELTGPKPALIPYSVANALKAS